MRHSGRPDCIRVAILDGDPDWTKRASNGLELNLGAQVDVVTDPDGFLRNGAVPPHVVIVSTLADPGFVVLRRLREQWDERQLPVIVTDGETEDDEGQISAMRHGANAFFDRTIHEDTVLLERLVSTLAHV